MAKSNDPLKSKPWLLRKKKQPKTKQHTQQANKKTQKKEGTDLLSYTGTGLVLLYSCASNCPCSIPSATVLSNIW